MRAAFRAATVMTALAALVLTSVSGAGASDRQATVPALRGALLFNFVKFVEWPVETLAAADPITVCVVEQPAVAEALEQASSGRNVEGHAVRVVRVSADDPLRSCHVVDTSGTDAQKAARIVQLLRDAPILTVGDSDKFAARGGVLQLFVENNQMHFGVNVAAAQHARLRVSSRLLSLARLIEKE